MAAMVNTEYVITSMYMMPELIPAPYFPLVRAVDAAPAAHTEHCAIVHKGDRSKTKAKNILETLFILQHLHGKYTKLRNYSREKSLNKPLPL
jgi:hypothetical protein